MVEPLKRPLDATGFNHEHRRQRVGPRRKAGRPCDAAAWVRTDLSPHIFLANIARL
uniref:Uncharacterized protein n=1 Tax=blood disease bacterium R229 TaxID=741978 RepID=G2ZQ91_9RALS|nr:hypothetical protein BDB_120268 [blood disease bacterium R229]